ncbi:MAG: type II secretion system F family protein [Thermodesulfovibrionia bacterium]
MAVYSYKATSLDGRVSEGVIEATDERTAIERLRDSGLIPIRVVSPREGILKRLSTGRSKGDILTFTTELSALLKAGLPLDRSLNILSELSEDKTMKEVIRSILQSIREGLSFSDALQKHPRVFPQLYVNMVRAGEAGGVLDIVLEKLREFLESTKELKDSLISAMIYPAILMVTGITSIIILLVYVLPKFSVIFSEMGAALPLPTRVVIGVSKTIADFWWLIISLIIAGVIIFRNYIRSDNGRYKWDEVKLKLMGDIIRRLETARFSRTLGTLLSSGVPLLQALSNSKGTINNRVIASVIDNVSRDAKEGKGISAPLSRAGVFPPLAISMIRVGEESGQLDTMLLQVAETYEISLRATLKRFLSLLEPAMILFMALIIGFIVLSMLMAIFSITQLPL